MTIICTALRWYCFLERKNIYMYKFTLWLCCLSLTLHVMHICHAICVLSRYNAIILLLICLLLFLIHLKLELLTPIPAFDDENNLICKNKTIFSEIVLALKNYCSTRLCQWHVGLSICLSVCSINQCWYNVGPPSTTFAQHYAIIGWALDVCWAGGGYTEHQRALWTRCQAGRVLYCTVYRTDCTAKVCM